VGELDPSGPESSHADAAPLSVARGATIDRFVVHEVLGAGAMGVVVAAHDPQLDRKVAIKLVHPAAGADAELRLARE
jgi:eukaryotic-like serine/threonine-protein kinase